MSGGSVHFHSILVYLHTSTYRSISTKVVGGTIELDNVDDNDFTEEDHESTLESDEIKVISREITKVGSKFQCPQCDKLSLTIMLY